MAKPYHHGDLRSALLDAAHTVLDEEGVGALSLRDLARRAGVSPTAPYHHFASKADLVQALCEDALGALDAALAEAFASADEPHARLQALGAAYVRFAATHPERFRLAFRPEMGAPFAALALPGATLPADTVGFRHLVAAVRALEPDPARHVPRALAAWSVAHGLAALLVDGPLGALALSPEAAERLARDVLAAAS